MRLAFIFGLIGVLLVAGCGGDDDNGSADTAPQTAAAETSQERDSGCRRVGAPEPKPDPAERQPPTAELDPAKRYDITFTTNCGAFTVRLDQKAAPTTAASFVWLARKGFFDGTQFHRIVPGFVIQGGDPTGSGQGGPGYTTTDKPAADTVYERGTVAMAKTGAEPAGTAGSQFFVVTGEASELTPEYAKLGRVVRGMAVVERISQLGDPRSGGSGTPMRPVVIGKTKVAGS